MRIFLTYVLAAILIFPYVALLMSAGGVRCDWGPEVAEVFLNTALQALASAVASVAAGVAGGLGLLWLGPRVPVPLRRLIEGVAILPNAAPVLLLLLAVMRMFPGARGFPGIVFVHALLNSGLVAVAVAHSAAAKITGMAELAWVEGAGGLKFLLRVAFPVLRSDLGFLFLFVFAVCFVSFAVPLSLGGSQATTVEVLIYQNIRINADWARAMGLALIQTFAILAFSWTLRRGEAAPLAFRRVRAPLLEWAPGLVVVTVPVLILIWGMFEGMVPGLRQLRLLPELQTEIPALLAGSVVVGFGSGLAVVLGLLALAFARPEHWWRRFFNGYAVPSSVLVGFALLLSWREPGLATYFKIAGGIALVALPSFYRLQWSALLASLEGQVTVGRTLGAGDSLLFRRLMFPQLIQPACRLGGVAALWAWGDFALSSVVAERQVTLAMAAQALMGSYRLDGATVLVWTVLVGGLSTYAVFAGAGYVLGPESET